MATKAHKRCRIPRLRLLDPIWIKWVDAVEDPSHAGSVKSDTSEFGKLSEAIDHGFYVRHDAQELVVARTVYPDGEFAGSFTVLRGWLRGVKKSRCPWPLPRDEAR